VQDMLNFVKNPPRRTSHRSRRPCRLSHGCTGSLGSCDSNEPARARPEYGVPWRVAGPGDSGMAVVAVDRHKVAPGRKGMRHGQHHLQSSRSCPRRDPALAIVCLADHRDCRYSFYNGQQPRRSGSPTTSRCSRRDTLIAFRNNVIWVLVFPVNRYRDRPGICCPIGTHSVVYRLQDCPSSCRLSSASPPLHWSLPRSSS